ncbi:MAG: peptidoglycan editing factor PgeF [Methylococcaceae bacterium]|nr:peptidoglycan editing factor PgeF [Methylococcaceae bacterium]
MTQNNYLIPDWDVPANIHAAMTLRTGGVSSGSYDSLNPAAHVDDNSDSVLKNRQRINTMLGLPFEPVWLNQVHSPDVVELNHRSANLTGLKDLSGLMTADASFSCESNIVCAVLTADCLPLLLCSKDGEKIAAIHAGWRGLYSGIITNTINALNTKNLTVWLGAAIGACCFEVGVEVREQFITKNPQFATAFTEHAKEKYLADIYQLARIELALNGVNDIYGGDFCTVCNTQRFYSYRRDKQTGRMATLIWKD